MTDIDDDWDGEPDDHGDYDERDDYDDSPEPDEYEEYYPEPPDPWDYSPSLRERLRGRYWDLRRWIDVRLHPDHYDDEPPF